MKAKEIAYASGDRQRRRATHTRKQSEALGRLSAKVAALGDEALLDEYELAAYLGKSVQWLRNRRINGATMPRFVKIGQAVRYRLGDNKA